jgi:hypothetical protein
MTVAFKNKTNSRLKNFLQSVITPSADECAHMCLDSLEGCFAFSYCSGLTCLTYIPLMEAANKNMSASSRGPSDNPDNLPTTIYDEACTTYYSKFNYIELFW